MYYLNRAIVAGPVQCALPSVVKFVDENFLDPQKFHDQGVIALGGGVGQADPRVVAGEQVPPALDQKNHDGEIALQKNKKYLCYFEFKPGTRHNANR